jgi:hypothetical protein
MRAGESSEPWRGGYRVATRCGNCGHEDRSIQPRGRLVKSIVCVTCGITGHLRFRRIRKAEADKEATDA